MRDSNYNVLPMEDRPHVKAYALGFQALTDAELISMVINRGAGTRESLEQAHQMVNLSGRSLKRLKKMRIEEIEVIQGIGDCKALAVLAALELGRRLQREQAEDMHDMGSATAIYNYLFPRMADLDHEEAHLLLMNQNFKLIKHEKISSGGITETAVDIRIIMREAVLNNATMLAIAHNHPSNNNSPSRDDDRLTSMVSKACEAMRIHFVDHVIITDGKYYSYRENGRL